MWLCTTYLTPFCLEFPTCTSKNWVFYTWPEWGLDELIHAKPIEHLSLWKPLWLVLIMKSSFKASPPQMSTYLPFNICFPENAIWVKTKETTKHCLTSFLGWSILWSPSDKNCQKCSIGFQCLWCLWMNVSFFFFLFSPPSPPTGSRCAVEAGFGLTL